MLVLSRKLGEKFIIAPGTPGEITVTVVDIDRGKIRLGIEAPRDILIFREEMLPARGRGESRDTYSPEEE